MAAKRKVDNLMALAVLATVIQQPMHRYEIASLMRARGKDQDMDVKWGSLYTVVQNLAKHGFLEVVGTSKRRGAPSGKDGVPDHQRSFCSTGDARLDPGTAVRTGARAPRRSPPGSQCR